MSDSKQPVTGTTPRKRGRPPLSARRQGVPDKYAMTKRVHILMDLQMYARLQRLLTHDSPRDIKTSLSAFIRRAIIRYMNDEHEYWPLAFKHLSSTTMEIRTMHEELKRFCDAFIHYLSYYFILWPDIPQEERHERSKHSAAMVEHFVEGFQERLRKGGHLWKFTPEHMQELFMENAPELELEDERQRYDMERKKDAQKVHRSTGSTTKQSK